MVAVLSVTRGEAANVVVALAMSGCAVSTLVPAAAVSPSYACHPAGSGAATELMPPWAGRLIIIHCWFMTGLLDNLDTIGLWCRASVVLGLYTLGLSRVSERAGAP
jgi:hypothetical protein